MKFSISVIFIETFLEQSISIGKWVSWWCHRLTIFHVFCSQKCENPIFQLWESKTCLISTLNKCTLMFASYFDMETCFHMFEPKKNENFQNCINKIYGKLWGDEIINSLICMDRISLEDKVLPNISLLRSLGKVMCVCVCVCACVCVCVCVCVC